MAISFLRRDWGDAVTMVRIISSDSVAVCTAEGYLTAQQSNIIAANNGVWSWLDNDFVLLSASDGHQLCSLSADHSSLVPYTAVIPLSQEVSSSSATPDLVVFSGVASDTNAVITSGSVTGLSGSADIVGASGGRIAGVVGSSSATGTLSGTSQFVGVNAQLNIASATINAGAVAPVWAEYSITAGTLTDVSKTRMFVGINPIAALTLNSMIYLDGKASNLFELDNDAGTYITAAAGGTIGANPIKIKFTVGGVTKYLIAADDWT